ncbi:peptidoglycan DD-metalloendopeptidase family protein [Streptomyces sp. NPDC048603]|uniref:M23 family metallopeptidase n=1 Tax=Streptomyces sp. NPDC048603 TaxID=3365577 RepID=UPI0037121FDF
MPGKGKHRRPKSRPISRGFVAAGTGGAALALPLLGATSANAVELPAAPTVTALPAQAPAAAPVQAVPASLRQAPSVYTVVSGDCLSQIAQDQDIPGGWPSLYAGNREAVGSNPDLIRPGLRLTLSGADGADAGQAEAPAEQPAAPEAEAPEEEVPAPQEEAPQAAAPQPSAPKSAAPQRTTTGTASRSERAAAPASAAGFVAPVIAGINTPYKASGSMWASGTHTGVDFGATFGTSVKAVGAGTVVSAGWAGSYGNEVIIRHADGHYSQYGHMSQLSVSVGQTVTAGQEVGLVGSTGNSTGPHLHFEIRTTQSYGSDIDPLAYLRSKGVSV